MRVRDIEKEARLILGQSDQANSRWGSDTFLVWMNDGLERICIEAEALIQDFFGDATIGRAEYPLPREAMAILEIRFDNRRLKKVSKAELDGLDASWLTREPGTPKAYYHDRIIGQDKTLSLYPAPAEVKPITIKCLMRPTLLTGSEAIPEIPEEYHRVLVPYLVYRAYSEFGTESELRLASIYMNEFAGRLKSMKQKLMLEDRDTPLEFRLAPDVHRRNGI